MGCELSAVNYPLLTIRYCDLLRSLLQLLAIGVLNNSVSSERGKGKEKGDGEGERK
jgi:hypothetical protein